MSYVQSCCFFRTLFIVRCSKMNTPRFGSWLCLLLQVKILILLGKIERANPSPWTICVYFTSLSKGSIPEKSDVEFNSCQFCSKEERVSVFETDIDYC